LEVTLNNINILIISSNNNGSSNTYGKA